MEKVVRDLPPLNGSTSGARIQGGRTLGRAPSGDVAHRKVWPTRPEKSSRNPEQLSVRRLLRSAFGEQPVVEFLERVNRRHCSRLPAHAADVVNAPAAAEKPEQPFPATGLLDAIGPELTDDEWGRSRARIPRAPSTTCPSCPCVSIHTSVRSSAMKPASDSRRSTGFAHEQTLRTHEESSDSSGAFAARSPRMERSRRRQRNRPDEIAGMTGSLAAAGTQR